ncbi:MAG: pyridoxamine 5'-phosphate oxidase family protein [Planctomycetota bacterium]
MALREYFEQVKGLGVLATADVNGKVDVAVYARPHFLGDGEEEVSFIMNDRLSHDNVVSNPHAAYLFVENTEGYVGKRLFLTKLREETDEEKIESVRRRQLPAECEEGKTKKRFLVHFRVDGVRPLIGSGQ